MNYITSSEIAKKWEISPRRVVCLASCGRIPGARLVGKVWMIPENARKPADGRTKTARARSKKSDCFRFPLYLNFDESSYSPPLSPEESALRTAQIAFYACEFAEAKEKMKPLTEAKNRYVRMAALYHICVLSFLTGGNENYGQCRASLTAEFSDDFPRKKEMELLFYMLDDIVGANGSIYENFTFDAEYDYHPSVYCIMIVFSLISMGSGDLSVVSKIKFDTYELLCRQMEHDGYYLEAQILHCVLFTIYHLQAKPEKTLRHIKRALEIAEELNLFFFGACYEYYYPDEYKKALEDFSPEFGAKIRACSNELRNGYVKFTDKYSASSVFSSLAKKDFAYVFYATQGYSYKEIANFLGTTESYVANKYASIYSKLGVRSRPELVERFLGEMNDPKC